MKMKETDVLVIGGGVNGAGIARDLAGRGLTVILCEKDDLAAATSSASTKLIHGGLRYLEYGKFGLVREALKEREVLLRAAPHLISPLTFVLPHHGQLRPWWLIRLGLFLYDWLGGHRTLPRSRGLSFTGTKAGAPLKPAFRRGFSYSDCRVDDARLVVLCALDAYQRGAQVLTRTECVKIEKHAEGGWAVTLRDHITGSSEKVRAQVVVNASGPWVNEVLGLAAGEEVRRKLRWVKGSHIIVPRFYQGDQAYILQQPDKRVVFAIPYEKKFTLIGTTEVEHHGEPGDARISMEEIDYLCTAVNRYFRHQVKPENVEWTYSGVRPLVEDGAASATAATREYIVDAQQDGIVNVYGGKITTFRTLSEHVGDKVVALLGRGKGPWTAGAALPGGEGSAANFETFLKTLQREYNWLPPALAQRYARAYGARAREFLRGFKRIADLGENLGEGVYEAEIAYLAHSEWALTADDILWRRSKLGLHLSEDTQKNIAKVLKKVLAKKA